jgi:hypothetical protein
MFQTLLNLASDPIIPIVLCAVLALIAEAIREYDLPDEEPREEEPARGFDWPKR